VLLRVVRFMRPLLPLNAACAWRAARPVSTPGDRMSDDRVREALRGGSRAILFLRYLVDLALW